MKGIYIPIINIITGFMVMAASFGCCPIDKPEDDCVDAGKSRKVLLLYSAGYNSLRNYLLEDIGELKQGWLPGSGCKEDILLVYSHTPKVNGAYDIPTSPHLMRIYKDDEGKVITDTLKSYPAGSISASGAQLNEVLTYVRDNFEARSYGMIFSSHATGYLPAGYYSDPYGYRFTPSGMMRSRAAAIPMPVPYIEPDFDPSLPMVKSIGQDQVGAIGQRVSYEMDIADFAEAIPMELDYILFDACLMGGIEVAFELRDKCRLLGFSQAEVLAEGFDYKTLTKHLLEREEPYPQGVCEDYFMQYDVQSGVYRSATISLVDCSRLEPLAEVCRDFFTTHREEIDGIDPEKTQVFFRSGKHWFYDLESIIIQAGADENELAELHSALEECVLYKGHTPEFMSEFRIDTFSGFSMYLPGCGTEELAKFYKTLLWNQATMLVE